MMLVKNVEGYNLPLPQEGQTWSKEQFPSQNELMQEQQRLQQEHASAVQRGDMATARRMERLMQMNSARMQNYAMKSEEWFELVKQTDDFDERLANLQQSRLNQAFQYGNQQTQNVLPQVTATGTEAQGQAQDDNFAFFEQQQAQTEEARTKANAEKQKKQAQLARQKGKEAANRRRLMEGAKAKVGQQASRLLGEPSLPNVETGARVASLPGKVIPAIGSAVDAMRPSSVASAINTVTGGAANRITKPGREKIGRYASAIGQRVADPATRLASGQQLSEERQKKQERTQSEMGDYATDARARSILTRNVNPDGTRRKKGEMNITAEDEKTIAEIQRI